MPTIPNYQKQKSTANSTTIKPPIMGWNTKDCLADMDPSYAVEAENFFSNGSSVDLRRGYTRWAKNIANTLTTSTTFTLNTQAGTSALLAIGDTGRTYDVSAGGGSPTDLSAAGSKLVFPSALAVNFKGKIFIKDYGSTNCWQWDGSAGSITHAAFTGPSGGDTLLGSPRVYGSRLIFVGLDASFWYGALNAITGALTQYDLSSFLELGGKLLFAGGVSRTGQTNNQYFAAISDQGEVLLYSGTDPNSAATFQLIGHYYMPQALGVRSFFYYGADLLVITVQGLVSLSQVLSGTSPLTFLTDKISDAFIAAIAPSNAPGLTVAPDFMGMYYPQGNMLIITGNAQSTTANIIFAMSTITGSWWKWSGISANCFTMFNNIPYFAGLNGKVFKFWNGYSDENPAVDDAILTRTIKLRPAYNYLGSPEIYKQFTAVIPTVYQSNTLSLTIDSDVDYQNQTAVSTIVDATKGNTYQVYQPRCGLTKIGKAVSIRIDGTVTDKQMSLQALEVIWNEGDIW